MDWRRIALLPRLIASSAGAPRRQDRAWERFWAGVRSTGPKGDVLWDAGWPAEQERTTALLRKHADLSLPIVDLGCGSGRQARALTGLAPRVIGIDGSPSAIAHAARTPGDVDFRVGDLGEPGLGERLAGELGDCNVHLRGVLHVLDDTQRGPAAETIAALLGTRGTLVLCETDQRGDPLDFLIAQGARPTHLPPPVRRLIRSGVRAPRHFGDEELAAWFPGWPVLESGPAVMAGVPLTPGGPPQRIPSYYAVIRASAR